jgi:hypothetical protein
MASISLSKAEKSFIQAGLLANPPSRADGRSLLDFRAVALETGVAPIANGSARLNIGRSHDGGGGTEVLAASKLEVENIDEEGVDGGRIVCTVSWFVSWFSSEYPCQDRLNNLTVVPPQHIRISLLAPWMISNMICLRFSTKHSRIPRYTRVIWEFC